MPYLFLDCLGCRKSIDEGIRPVRRIVRNPAACLISRHYQVCRTDAAGEGISKGNVCYLRLLFGRQVRKQYDNRRYFSGRGRFAVRAAL